MNSKQQLIARVIFQQKWMTEAQIRNAYDSFHQQNLSISFLDFLEKKQFISSGQKVQVVKIITSSLHQTRPHNFSIKENQRFLQYDIEREIGHGGMGVVYKAKDLKLQRDVAIKVLSNTNRNSVQLFIQEARTIAQLNHPYVIKIYDVGETPLSYFVMEYIDGYTLEDYMYSRKISFHKWAIFFHKMAQALDFIHQKEIIHRDIKPANIMIDKDGEPRLMDFGLAKTHEDKSLPSGFVGTPSYASPEQIESNSTSVHSDIYSLGATLYEALTNTKIFQGEMVHLVYQIIKSDPVHPKTLNPSIPVDLQAICLKCIAKKPLHRYQTAAHLANDLDNFIHNRPVTAKSPSYLDITKKWIARNMLLSCFIFLFLVSIHTALAIFISANNNLSTAYAKLQLQQQKTQEQKYKMQLQLYHASLNKMEDFVQHNSFTALTKTLDQYSQQNFLLNKSQNYLQLSTELNPSKKLEIRLLNNLFHKPQNLVSNHFYYSNFSVNKTNTFAATNYGQELRIIDLQNDKQKKYVVKERISCTAFHPYKPELFVGGVHGVVFKIDLTTGQQTQLDIYPQLQSWITFGRFSADGSQLVYCIVNSRGESSLVVLDWQTHEYRVVTPKLTARADEGTSINMEQIINIACTKNNRILMLTGKKNAGLGIFYFVGNTTVKLFETEKIITDIALHNNTIVISYLSGELVFGKINDHGTKITYRQTNKQSQAHQGAILSISATSDHIVSCGRDNVIKIWGYDGKLQHSFSHTHFIKAHFIPKSNRLLTMNFYKHIQLWSLTRKSPTILRGAKKWANLAISPQSRYLALTIKTSISLIEIWDLQKRKPIKILPDGVGKLDFRQMNSIFVNENQLLTRGEKIVRYWNIHKANNFQQVLRYKNQNYTHQDNVEAMNCVKSYIITTDSQKLCLWNKKSKRLEKEWDSLFENICFADFYAENTLIVGSMIKDGSLQFEFVNTHNGNVHRTPLTVTDDEGKETPFYNTVKQHAILHFHNKKYLFLISKFAKQDASLIYMFTCDHTLKKQTLCATFTGHSGNINKIAFTHDSSRMVSAGHDHSIKVWDLENIKKHPVANECLLSIKEHTAPVTGVVFNKDGSELISVSEDQTIRIWSLQH